MADSGDIKAHAQTYAGFMSMVKIGSLVCFLGAMIVVFLIAN